MHGSQGADPATQQHAGTVVRLQLDLLDLFDCSVLDRNETVDARSGEGGGTGAACQQHQASEPESGFGGHGVYSVWIAD